MLRLIYAGRNGLPYSSIGRILIQTGAIKAEEMLLAALKAAVRAAGQTQGEACSGPFLMQRNESYVFFRIELALDAREGPVGGAGLSLTPPRLRSRSTATFTPWLCNASLDHAEIPWESSAPTPSSVPDDCAGHRLCYHRPARAAYLRLWRRRRRRTRGEYRQAGEFVVFLPVEEGLAPVKESASSFSKGRLRRLSAEEIELWLAVAKTVSPRPSRVFRKRPPH